MASAVRVNRCRACKSRKIKCDENWPTCGYCQRTNKVCSGPPAAFSTFLSWSSSSDCCTDSGQSSEGTGSDSLSVSSGFENSNIYDEKTLVQTRERQAEVGGGVFMRLRSKPKKPRRPSLLLVPSSSTESLTRGLVCLIEAGEGAARDISLTISWVHLLPSRLESSPALCDATRLYINSWSKAQEANVSGSTLDRKAYVKSLKSLRLALDHPQAAFNAATLAATLLINAAELEFNLDRKANQTSHTVGMGILMKERGQPRVDDELDVCLCYDVLGTLLAPTILSGKPSFIHGPEWLHTLRLAQEAGTVRDDSLRRQHDLYFLTLHWPGLAGRLREVYASPNTASALEVAMEAGEIAQALLNYDNAWIQPILADQSQVWTVPDETVPSGLAYQFAEWDACALVSNHAMASLAVNQMQYAALVLGSTSAEYLSPHLREMSERVWMSLTYAVSQPPAARNVLLAALVLSFEYASMDSREMLVKKTKQLLGPRAVLLGDSPVVTMLDLGRRLTGRPVNQET